MRPIEFVRDAMVLHSGSKLLGLLDDAKIARHYRDINRHPTLRQAGGGKRVGMPTAAYIHALRQGTPAAVISLPAVSVAGMVAATAYYPEIAGPQYQSAMSGQIGIGSAGHDLIYGGKRNIFEYLFGSF